MKETIFIKILKILESYQIEWEKCVKYPTPLARELTKIIKADMISFAIYVYNYGDVPGEDTKKLLKQWEEQK